MKPLYLLVICTLIIIPACKKNNGETTGDLLTSKPWKLATVDDNTATSPSNRIYYAAKPCEKDDTFNFANNGQLTINAGQTQCEPSEPAVVTEAYSIDQVNKKIVINGTTYTLAELTATQLKYYTAVPGTTGYTNIVYLYQH